MPIMKTKTSSKKSSFAAAKKTAKVSSPAIRRIDLTKFFENIFSKSKHSKMADLYIRAELAKKGMDEDAIKKLMKSVKVSVDRLDLTIDVKAEAVE